MIRGTLYGSICAALTITLLAGVPFPLNLPFAALAWLFILMTAGLPLVLASLVVLPVQEKLRRTVKGRLYGPVAVLAALPFGLLICIFVMKMLGWADRSWLLQDWVSPLRVGIAGGLGLGLGCAHDVLERN